MKTTLKFLWIDNNPISYLKLSREIISDKNLDKLSIFLTGMLVAVIIDFVIWIIK
jgi:hypothetical protein